MKMRLSLIHCFFLIFPILTQATDFAQVKKLEGTVLFNGKNLKLEDKIGNNGFVETGPNSFLTLQFINKNSDLQLAENSKMHLTNPDPSGPGYGFEKGACRWIVKPSETKNKWIRIRTKSATLGVRGTDFALFFNPILEESEILTKRGKVEFQSLIGNKESKLVHENQWGGVGGRFGDAVRVMTLDPPLLEKLFSPFLKNE